MISEKKVFTLNLTLISRFSSQKRIDSKKGSDQISPRGEIYGFVLIIIACAVLKLWKKKDLKIQWGKKGT